MCTVIKLVIPRMNNYILFTILLPCLKTLELLLSDVFQYSNSMLEFWSMKSIGLPLPTSAFLKLQVKFVQLTTV